MRQLQPASYEVELRSREAKVGPEAWLVMERLFGPELSIDALCVEGDLLKWMVREKRPSGGQVVMADHEVMDHVRHLIKALGLHGIVSVQYMYDAHGHPKLLEINLRPSGGCIAYGETVLAARGVSGLLTDWLQLMAGMIAREDIQPWCGKEVAFHTKTVVVVE